MIGDQDSRNLAVKTEAAVFMAVAAVAVLLRCYVRGRIVKAFGWDDASMVLAMACYFLFCGTMIGGTLYGTGRKFETLTPHQRVTAMKYWWLCEIAYCFSSIFCKISVCLFLMRITVKRVHIAILYIVMVLTVLAGLVFMFLMLLQCKPLQYFWLRTAPGNEGHCISIDIIINMTYVYSAVAALCDFTCGLLPIFMVHKLHMRRKTKLAVVGILGMACIASSAVIIRIPFVKTFADPDFLYATFQIAIWSNVETGLGITAGSLATLRPLLRHWLGSRSDPDYSASPFPGASGSRRVRGSGPRPFPLASLDGSVESRLRPDKLAVTVTTVKGDTAASDTIWRGSSSVNSSEERLTGSRAPRERSPRGHGHDAERADGGLSIHQTFEVTQSSEMNGGVGEREREHV